MNGILENFFKINRPTNRLEFFKYTICMLLAQFVLSLLILFSFEKLIVIESSFLLLILFSIIIVLPLLYLYFVQFAKRLWDITESSNIGIISSIIIFVIMAATMAEFPALGIAIYLTLILVPGKLVKNNE